MTIANFEISVVSSSSLVNVETLGLRPPRSTFLRYADIAKNMDGSTRGVGWPIAIWDWDMMTAAQYEALRALCPSASVPCWIRTLTDDTETYKYYAAVLRWPAPPDNRRAGTAIQMRFEFVSLVGYIP